MDFDARMAALQQRFRVRAGEDGERIAAAFAAGDLAAVRSLAHGLSGSAGVFGFPDVSKDAQELEEAVEAGAAPADLTPLCDRLLARLARVAQRD